MKTPMYAYCGQSGGFSVFKKHGPNSVVFHEPQPTCPRLGGKSGAKEPIEELRYKTGWVLNPRLGCRYSSQGRTVGPFRTLTHQSSPRGCCNVGLNRASVERARPVDLETGDFMERRAMRPAKWMMRGAFMNHTPKTGHLTCAHLQALS